MTIKQTKPKRSNFHYFSVEIEKKMNKMNNFDSINQIDEKMSEGLKSNYSINQKKMNSIYLI